MSNTEKNVWAAFAGESQANRKYLAFAKRAEKDGFKQVARLFRAAAYAETVHALSHLDVVGGVDDTAANLKKAVDGETHEFTTMYPGFINQAEADGNKRAKRSFEMANEVEKIHEKLYRDALKSVEGGKDLSAAEIHVCEICGFTAEGHAPDTCPVCGAKKEKFTKID